MNVDHYLGQLADRCSDIAELSENAQGYGIAEMAVRLESLADDLRAIGDALADELRP